ncbi:uncharacterized protein N7477_004637 [Penicillium maclennaniae]|uniref:uncharacterized protein n=1 Tax=Penicillium maclennaniae TaxID=1343394 RepID=UPI002540F742|nr:uncharacterized protein N7477_004637 [Penicillium maclennaniae]KAJ5674703.1 hypothetical protein N7477_004637 [Penicillium maclennaniae]
MAPEAPDPQSLKSWHDAFQYPIPTVRRVEQELRRDIASNKEKLRALVGTRYRELVGTAETIVSMNREIQEVEAILTDVGRRCNPRLVEKKHQHARLVKSDAAKKDGEKHAFGAQLALLHRCTTSIARLLRKRASLLLVAKIMVVSRLLHSTLTKHGSTPPFLDDLRNQLASLRRALLKRVDRRLTSTNVAEDYIVESLAAYCLATSSSSDDAIHHFHQVRLDVMVNQLALSRENIPKSLQLFVRTLQTSKVLRSRQFSDVLSKLKTRPLLSDPEIRGLDGLDIEVLGRWAAPDVKNFTPWIKLSEMSRFEGVESIKQWSLQAFDKFVESCQKSLAHSNNFNELLSLRADTVELWLSSWGSTITHSSVDVLERLRKIFHDHLKRVLTAQVQTIEEVAAQIAATIKAWETTEHKTIGSLWGPDIINADFSNGAVLFKQTVADRLFGRDEDVSTILQKYKSWLASIQEVKESIDSLRRLKWTDVLVGSEVEDEDIDVNPQLNEDDPKFLSDALHSAVQQALESLNSSIGEVFQSFGPSHASEKAVFLLRVIRLVRMDIPTDFLAKHFTFSSEVVPELQKLLATEIVAQNGSLSFVPSSKCHPETGKVKIVPGRSLWEGEPPVPVQPSPGAFKYLRRLTATMDEKGSDLWDPSTVKVLKQLLQKHLEISLGSVLDELEAWKPKTKESKSNGDKEVQNGGEEKDAETSTETETAETPELPNAPSHTEILRDWKVQLFFDAMYLANMLGDATQLAGVAERVQKSAEPSAEAVKAVRKLAQEYWKRTEMLFGLVA